jgi:hypothetical protein
MNLDADIYSSTMDALNHLEHKIVPGTILIFDEFNDRNHEFKAFREFAERIPGAKFKIVGTSWSGVLHIAFERIA